MSRQNEDFDELVNRMDRSGRTYPERLAHAARTVCRSLAVVALVGLCLVWFPLVATRGRHLNTFITAEHVDFLDEFSATLTVVVPADATTPTEAVLQTMHAVQRCKPVTSTAVLWLGGATPVPSALLSDPSFDVVSSTPPNHLLGLAPGLATDGALVLDAGSTVGCADLEFAFGVWELSPRQLVGFAARLHTAQTGERSGRAGDVWETGLYSMVGADGVFVHRNHTKAVPTPAEQAAVQKGCLDVVLNFRASAATRRPPRWVHARSFVSPLADEIEGERGRRAECVQDMSDQYGFPLVVTPYRFTNILDSWLF